MDIFTPIIGGALAVIINYILIKIAVSKVTTTIARGAVNGVVGVAQKELAKPEVQAALTVGTAVATGGASLGATAATTGIRMATNAAASTGAKAVASGAAKAATGLLTKNSKAMLVKEIAGGVKDAVGGTALMGAQVAGKGAQVALSSKPARLLKGKVYKVANTAKDKIANSAIGQKATKVITGVKDTGSRVYTSGKQTLDKMKNKAEEMTLAVKNKKDEMINSAIDKGLELKSAVEESAIGQGTKRAISGVKSVIKTAEMYKKGLDENVDKALDFARNTEGNAMRKRGIERIRKALGAEKPITAKDLFVEKFRATKENLTNLANGNSNTALNATQVGNQATIGEAKQVVTQGENQGEIKEATKVLNQGGNQGEIKEAKQVVIQGGNQGMIQGEKQEVIQDGNQGVIQGEKQEVIQDGNQGIIQGEKQEVIQDGNQGVIQGEKQEVIQDGNQGVIQGEKQEVIQDGNQGMNYGENGMYRLEEVDRIGGMPNIQVGVNSFDFTNSVTNNFKMQDGTLKLSGTEKMSAIKKVMEQYSGLSGAGATMMMQINTINQREGKSTSERYETALTEGCKLVGHTTEEFPLLSQEQRANLDSLMTPENVREIARKVSEDRDRKDVERVVKTREEVNKEMGVESMKAEAVNEFLRGSDTAMNALNKYVSENKEAIQISAEDKMEMKQKAEEYVAENQPNLVGSDREEEVKKVYEEKIEQRESLNKEIAIETIKEELANDKKFAEKILSSEDVEKLQEKKADVEKQIEGIVKKNLTDQNIQANISYAQNNPDIKPEDVSKSREKNEIKEDFKKELMSELNKMNSESGTNKKIESSYKQEMLRNADLVGNGSNDKTGNGVNNKQERKNNRREYNAGRVEMPGSVRNNAIA